MAKKSAEKGFIAKYGPKVLSFILSIPEEKREAYIRKFNSAIHFKKFLIRYAAAFILVLAALIVMLDGLGFLFGSFFPSLMPGVTHIIVGAIVIAAVVLYIKIQ